MVARRRSSCRTAPALTKTDPFLPSRSDPRSAQLFVVPRSGEPDSLTEKCSRTPACCCTAGVRLRHQTACVSAWPVADINRAGVRADALPGWLRETECRVDGINGLLAAARRSQARSRKAVRRRRRLDGDVSGRGTLGHAVCYGHQYDSRDRTHDGVAASDVTALQAFGRGARQLARRWNTIDLQLF